MTDAAFDRCESNPKIEVHDRIESLHQAAAEAFCDLVNHAVAARGLARISLSGGSTPKRLYELLSERQLPWRQIHWYWGDERNVPVDHVESNQRMVREALLNRVHAPQANIHPVPVMVDNPGSSASAYEQTLRSHFDGDAFPKWDLVLLGMGDDAHTASLFPGTDALQNQRRWFVENWVPKFEAFRYTLTAPAINSARQAWFLIAGAGKREALEHVWSSPQNPNDYPSQLIQPTRWFLTSDANPNQ